MKVEATPMDKKAVTLVPVFGALEETIDCVRSLLDSDARTYPIWLLDDGSAIEVARTLTEKFADDPSVRIVSHFRNRGYTENLSLALNKIESPYFCILNSDTIVPNLWFERLITKLEEMPIACAVGPVSNAASYQSVPEVISEDGLEFSVNECLSSGRDDISRYNQILNYFAGDRLVQAMLLNGFCTMFRTQAFLQAGKFDRSNFREGYGEENDLFIKMAREGWRSFIDPGVFVYHKKSASFGADRRAALSRRGNQMLSHLYGKELREEVDSFQSLMRPLKAIRTQFALMHSFDADVVNLTSGESLRVDDESHKLLNIQGPSKVVISENRVAVEALSTTADRVVVSLQRNGNLSIDLPEETQLRLGTRRPSLSALAALCQTSFERAVFVEKWEVDGHPDQQDIANLSFGMLFSMPSS